MNLIKGDKMKIIDNIMLITNPKDINEKYDLYFLKIIMPIRRKKFKSKKSKK